MRYDIHQLTAAQQRRCQPLASAQAEMREPLKSLVGLPVDVEGIAARLPQFLQPPGL